MSHLPVLPIVIPALTAAVLLALRDAGTRLARATALASIAAVLACAVTLMVSTAGGEHLVYALGDWPAPYGIVLVVDRLSALMLVLTAALALAAAVYATAGWDNRGPYFHPLFQLQLMGLNGAFLTGDLFNLFVFFEVLLSASYCLLLHGLGERRLRAAVHYVVINLTASSLFLVAVAVLYGVAGTLNLAHLAERLREVPQADAAAMRSAGLLLMAVFGVKAAAFPLYFWLPRAYAAAGAPVAALFSIMTKVGVYAIARVAMLVFGLDDFAAPWLLPVALVTLVLGTLGAVGASSLGALIAYLVVNSVGTLLTALAVGGEQGVSAALYYLPHSVVVLAALFLVVELVARQRGEAADRLRASPALLQPALLGIVFLLAAAMVAGLPPFAGFLGKVMLLAAVTEPGTRIAVWGGVLGTSLLAALACMRAGVFVFWKQTAPHPGGDSGKVSATELSAVGLLLGGAALLAVYAAPVKHYTDAAARQLLSPRAYVEAVLAADAERRTRRLP